MLNPLRRIRRSQPIHKCHPARTLHRNRLVADHLLQLLPRRGLCSAPHLPRGRLILLPLQLLHDQVLCQIGHGGWVAVVFVERLEGADAHDALAEVDVVSKGQGHDAVGHDFGLRAGQEGG